MRRSSQMNQRLVFAIDRPNQIIFVSKTASREIRLSSRPKGIPTVANFNPGADRTGATARPAGARSQSLHVSGSIHARSH
jgi:hypothetical protein